MPPILEVCYGKESGAFSLFPAFPAFFSQSGSRCRISGSRGGPIAGGDLWVKNSCRQFFGNSIGLRGSNACSRRFGSRFFRGCTGAGRRGSASRGGRRGRLAPTGTGTGHHGAGGATAARSSSPSSTSISTTGFTGATTRRRWTRYSPRKEISPPQRRSAGFQGVQRRKDTAGPHGACRVDAFPRRQAGAAGGSLRRQIPSNVFYRRTATGNFSEELLFAGCPSPFPEDGRNALGAGSASGQGGSRGERFGPQ